MQTTTATDQYPEKFEIEIDREPLIKYYRVTHSIALAMIFSTLGLFISLIIAANLNENWKIQNTFLVILLFVTCVACGMAIAFLLTMVFNFLIIRGYIEKEVQHSRVFVDGPFLIIHSLEGSKKIDRKLHFRAIVDYSTIETEMMNKYGIQSLKLNTLAGGIKNTIEVYGVKDCLKVRDMLADIDRLRENNE